MRKLKIIEHISLDGVIQHSADDDDFPYSDWTAPYRIPAGRDIVMARGALHPGAAVARSFLFGLQNIRPAVARGPTRRGHEKRR